MLKCAQYTTKMAVKRAAPAVSLGLGVGAARQKLSDRFCQNLLEPRNAKAERRVRRKAVWQRYLPHSSKVFLLVLPRHKDQRPKANILVL